VLVLVAATKWFGKGGADEEVGVGVDRQWMGDGGKSRIAITGMQAGELILIAGIQAVNTGRRRRMVLGDQVLVFGFENTFQTYRCK